MPEAGTPILLVNPLKPCPTGAVYKGWDGADRGSLAIMRSGWRNDLTPSAILQVPEIGMALYLLDDIGTASLVRMSGSGATCFALFDDVADRDEAPEIRQHWTAWYGIPAQWRFEQGVWKSNLVKRAIEHLGSDLHTVWSPHQKPYVEGTFNSMWTKLSVQFPDSDVGRFRGENEDANALVTAAQGCAASTRTRSGPCAT